MGSVVFSNQSSRALHTQNWLAPVQAVFAFFAQPQGNAHAQPNPRAEELSEPIQAHKAGYPVAHGSWHQAGQLCPVPAPLIKPNRIHGRACSTSSLKVLREFEPGKSRSSTGRLVISGRMADVCEILDRMVTQSAATH